ncbi:heterokaryon incompatibility protein-domain-containing protein [Lophiotrema nucula]|uniref:Heterokaryon incompatibility protein-domain-containing protein n=1 Tax=Lophiotrema nucula TaxID=690887 RepID=A0A6A5Z578_9PLEO|nr:heterokaryon incompatibility protein-domain-containing protein [Lophiotrema nucula]
MQNDPSTDFTYEPLDDAARQIRLLRVELAPDRKGVTGELKAVMLGSRSCPPFTTLSYVWGDRSKPHQILINGRVLKVLRGAWSFIWHIANHQKAVPNCPAPHHWMWIDSISINQDDDQEKGHQVAMMDQIYLKSSRTEVWLHEGAKELKLAIEFIQELADNEKLKSEDQAVKEAEMERLVDEKFKNKWAAINQLLLHPWWQRAWTLQEFILPKDLYFFTQLERREIKNSVAPIGACNNWALRTKGVTLVSDVAWGNLWKRRRLLLYRRDSKHISLAALLAYTPSKAATRAEDRIFSLLALVTDRDLFQTPDYSAGTARVFCNLVEFFIKVHKKLDIICFVTNQNDNADLQLPSWAPDWSCMVGNEGPTPLMASQSSGPVGNFRGGDSFPPHIEYKAAGTSTACASFSANMRQMTCRGVLVGVVDAVGPEVHMSAITQTHNTVPEPSETTQDIHPDDELPPLSEQKALEIMTNISRCIRLDTGDGFEEAHPQEPYTAGFRALCEDAVSGTRDKPKYQLQFHTWFHQMRDVRICGHSLRAISRSLPSAEASPADIHLMAIRFLNVCDYLNRRFFVTDDNNMGMAPRQVQAGDKVYVLQGCNIPVLLRGSSDSGYYKLLGECYLNKFMYGKALELKDRDFEDVVII